MGSLESGTPPGSTKSSPRHFPMKLSLPVRAPVRALGVALFDNGLRVREEYDELVLDQSDYALRIHVIERAGGSMVQCQVAVSELVLAPGSLGLFSEMALEGYPVVGVGACGGKISCEFSWFHPEGADWRISAERCVGLVDRVVGARVPLPRVRSHRAGAGQVGRLRAAA